MQKILVWDWPVRIGHWLLVASIALAWLTSESDSLLVVHALAGATALGVATFRLLWGIVGTRYARFGDFVRGPTAVRDYLSSLLRLQPTHYVGHNPAGGWAILLLLGWVMLTALTGWANYNDYGGHSLEELHEGLAASMLAIIAVHVGGVLLSSTLHRENLVRAMLSGDKLGEAAQAIPSARPLALVLLLAWIAAAGYWIIA